MAEDKFVVELTQDQLDIIDCALEHYKNAQLILGNEYAGTYDETSKIHREIKQKVDESYHGKEAE